jgi:hypothetical protein
VFHIPPYDISPESIPNRWQVVPRWLSMLNTFLCGFLIGLGIFWYAVEQGHYRPQSAAAQSQFQAPTK